MATPILMPRQGQSVESCILVAWKVSLGDIVKAGQPLADIETDKAAFEIESPAAGTVLDLFFEDGEDVPVLTVIGAIGTPGEDVSGLRGTSDLSDTSDSPQSAPVVQDDPETGTVEVNRPGISPRARGRAVLEGIDPAGVRGTGPGGRVIERDVAAASAAVRAQDSGSIDHRQGRGQTTEIKVTGVRKIIAERMHRSLSDTAQLTLNRRFDATAIQMFRKKAKEHGEEYNLPDVKLNDMIVYAASRTLQRHPELNAHFLGDRIVLYGDIHIGIAVDTPRGLLVPVLRDAGEMSLVRISETIRPIVEACRQGNVDPDLLSGGTFTITNLGGLGIESFTPVLNPPEVAILGVCAAALTPVMQDGEVRHIPAMNLSLTINHQAVDGAPAARFLADLASALENFELLLTAQGTGPIA